MDESRCHTATAPLRDGDGVRQDLAVSPPCEETVFFQNINKLIKMSDFYWVFCILK
jgi:hypothetical protein